MSRSSGTSNRRYATRDTSELTAGRSSSSTGRHCCRTRKKLRRAGAHTAATEASAIPSWCPRRRSIAATRTTSALMRPSSLRRTTWARRGLRRRSPLSARNFVATSTTIGIWSSAAAGTNAPPITGCFAASRRCGTTKLGALAVEPCSRTRRRRYSANG